MNALEIKKKIEYAREKRIAALFKNLIPETPSWDNFINHMDFEYKIDFSEKEKNKTFNYFGGIMMKEGFDLYFQVRYEKNSEGLPQVDKFMSLFNEVYNEKTGGGASFINFVGRQPLVPMHADKWDSVFWHCLGTARWTINLKEHDDTPEQTFYLEPGDVIVIPVGVLHSVYNEGPRAGIALGYNK